jgi:hypothetical protein
MTSNNLKYLLKFVSFLSIAFPGGYRFVSVLAITYLFPGDIAENFSKGFFWAVLILSFSGVPISAVMSSRLFYVNPTQSYAAAFVTTLIFSSTFYFSFFSTEEITVYLSVALASLFLSLYEITKKIYFNAGKYLAVFISACVSLLLLIPILLWKIHLLVGVYLVMFAPLFIAMSISRPPQESRRVGCSEFTTNYKNFMLSNAFSVSLNSVIPLLLIHLIGDEIAPNMAQVFSISSLLLLLPRIIAIRNITRARIEGPSKAITDSFYALLKYYIIIMGLISFIAFNNLIEDSWLILWLLLLGMQLSQLYLPFSNLLAVEGQSKTLMIVNLKGSLFFVLLTTLSFILLSGDDFILCFLIAFCLHHFYKLYLTRCACKKSNLYSN